MRPWWQVAIVGTVVSLVAAVLVGSLVGFGVGALTAADCDPNDGWCGLGAVLFGLAAGIVSGGIANIASAVLVVRRLRPVGHRAGVTAGVILGPPAVVLSLQLVGAVLSHLG